MSRSLERHLQDMRVRLKASGVENPALDARLLVQHALALSHEDMISSRDMALSQAQIDAIEGLIRRRCNREPVSRILGRREFWGMTFLLSRETLDPRPDSETLIEAVVEILHKRKDDRLRFLDLGTGTGCLLLALLVEFPQARGTGIDISEDASATAQKNARQLELGDRAEFLTHSWKDFFCTEKFDLVISNPPYISEEDIKALTPEVAQFDPHRALAGGADGLGCYRDIAALASEFLVPGGFLVLESGHDQAQKISGILQGAGFGDIQIRKDIHGHNRCIYGILGA